MNFNDKTCRPIGLYMKRLICKYYHASRSNPTPSMHTVAMMFIKFLTFSLQLQIFIKTLAKLYTFFGKYLRIR